MKGMILKNTALPSSAHSDPYHNEWKKLWSMATIPRHKALIWRIIQQAIPVRSALSKRGVQCLILCPSLAHLNAEDMSYVAAVTCEIWQARNQQ
ncbi:hypothetical protein L195_g032353, partial [Trifolium pratense]